MFREAIDIRKSEAKWVRRFILAVRAQLEKLFNIQGLMVLSGFIFNIQWFYFMKCTKFGRLIQFKFFTKIVLPKFV